MTKTTIISFKNQAFPNLKYKKTKTAAKITEITSQTLMYHLMRYLKI